MTILLPALAVAFAAFCVWLAVRVLNRRERWVKWTLAAAVGFPMVYFASFGPVVWLIDRGIIATDRAAAIYSPILAELRVDDVLWSYGNLGCRDDMTMFGLWFAANVKPGSKLLIDASETSSDHIGTLLPVLAVAFAACYVWLTVRVVNRRERWAKWTLAITVGLPVLYVASFGPWCWVVSHRTNPNKFVPVPTIFEPLTRWLRTGRVGDALEWYTKLGAAGGSFWYADGGLDPVDNSTSSRWCWMCPSVR